MATRSVHGARNEIVERRLRPIYDDLDAGCNSEAIRKCEKLLKKHGMRGKMQCARALKALAMMRLHRSNESFAMLEDLRQEHPTDEPTLQAMTLSYREMQKPEMIADIYGAAVKLEPAQEELLTHLFMAHVRLSDYKRQQQVAMQLYKSHPKNPYLFWSIMSIFMQAKTSDRVIASKMLLPLAEKMAAKHVNDKKLEADAELLMYLVILEEMGKWDVCIAMIEMFSRVLEEQPLQQAQEPKLPPPNTQRLFVSHQSYHCSRKYAEMLASTNFWSDVNRRQIIQLSNTRYANDFECYKLYIESVINLVKSDWRPESESWRCELEEEGASEHARRKVHWLKESPAPHITITQAVDFLQASRNKELDKRDRRSQGEAGVDRECVSPHLAVLEFYVQLQQHHMDTTSLGSLEDLIMDLFEFWGGMPMCCRYAMPYLSVCSPEQCGMLLEKMKLSVCGATTSNGEEADEDIPFAENLREMRRHQTFLQISHFCGAHNKLSADQQDVLASQVFRHWKHVADSDNKSLLTVANDYVILAVHVLLFAWRDSGKEACLWSAIVMLNEAVAVTDNPQLKLLIVKCYTYFGGVSQISAIFSEMEIRNMMFDSVGYVLTRELAALGHYGCSKCVVESILQYFSTTYMEIADHLINAYKYGAFDKVEDIVNLRHSTKHSLEYAVLTIEKTIIELTVESSSYSETERVVLDLDMDPELDEVEWELVQDKRNFSMLVYWNPPARCLTEAQVQRSFYEELSWLRWRGILLRCLSSAVLLAHHGLDATLIPSSPDPPNNNHANNSCLPAAADTPKLPVAHIISALIERLQAQYEQMTKDAELCCMYPVEGPYVSRIKSYMETECGELVADMMRLVLYIHRLAKTDEQDDGMQASDSSPSPHVCKDTLNIKLPAALTRLVEKCLADVAFNSQDKLSNRAGIERMVFTVECISQLCVLCGACQKLLKPMKVAHTRKKKKRKEPSNIKNHILEACAGFNKLFGCLAESVNILFDKYCKVMEAPTTVAAAASAGIGVANLSLGSQQKDEMRWKENGDAVWRRLEESYATSYRESCKVLARKRKYLALITL